ncbi:MAG: DUF192 domain-containing protein [Cyanobacteria bacterium REEB67]|nr:DUF192 domain-containing protein [Cyanobacteria bacterium REEB67]
MSKQQVANLSAVALTAVLLCGAKGAHAMMPTVKLGSEVVKLEVAETPAEITKGLMFRTSMPETQGMVFIFPPGQKVAFWMKNTLIPLDMVFIKDGKIEKICKDVPPCKSKDPEGADCPVYPSRALIEVSEVIEVNAGFCERHGVKEGDEVKFDFKK